MLFTSIDLEVEVQALSAQDEGSGYGVNLEVNHLLPVLEQLDINQDLGGQEVSVLLDHILGIKYDTVYDYVHKQTDLLEVILNCLKRSEV